MEGREREGGEREGGKEVGREREGGREVSFEKVICTLYSNLPPLFFSWSSHRKTGQTVK